MLGQPATNNQQSGPTTNKIIVTDLLMLIKSRNICYLDQIFLIIIPLETPHVSFEHNDNTISVKIMVPLIKMFPVVIFFRD